MQSSDHEYGSRNSARAPTRTRQACQNCRRKKVRCPGNRPQCSFCIRLKQPCVYATRPPSTYQAHHDRGSPPTQTTAERFDALENSLRQLTAAIERERVPEKQPSPFPISDFQLPEEVVTDGIALYFTNYCCQPCPILYSTRPHGQLDPASFPTVVLTAMLALSLHSCSHPFMAVMKQKLDILRALSDRTWNLLCKNYSNYDFNESYFQALCLLAQADFADGKTSRAQVQVALGLRLAQSRGMLAATHYESSSIEDATSRQEIVWSLFMLDRMFIGDCIRGPSIPDAEFDLPNFKNGPLYPGSQNYRSTASGLDSSSEHQSGVMDVITLNIEIIRIWGLVTSDMSKSTSSHTAPFWRHDSSRGKIMAELLEYELNMEPHTWATVGPPTTVLQMPHSRDYFRAVCFFQLLHCAVYCCLNHPFIIFIQTRRLNGRVPLTFLQKSYKYAMNYAHWIYKLISEAETAEIAAHSPFVGFMVGIAASIHLESSNSKHDTVSLSAQSKFSTCIAFLVRLSEKWPIIKETVAALGKLRTQSTHRSTMTYVDGEYDGSVPRREDRHVSVSQDELSLMWKLLDFTSMAKDVQRLDYRDGEITHTETIAPELHDTRLHRALDHENESVTPHTSISRHSNDLDAMHDFLNEYEPGPSLCGDWTLFGRPWEAYFPQDGESTI